MTQERRGGRRRCRRGSGRGRRGEGRYEVRKGKTRGKCSGRATEGTTKEEEEEIV